MRSVRRRRRLALVSFAALACLALLALPGCRAGTPGTVARVEVDGEVVRRIDLRAVAAAGETFEIITPWGTNTVELRPGGIRVLDADCPDRICVNQGWLQGGFLPIVCLPHRLVISLESGGSADAPDAVTG